MQVGVILTVDEPDNYTISGVFGRLSRDLHLLSYAVMTGPAADQTQAMIYFTLPDCAVVWSGLRRVIYADEVWA